MLQMSPSKESNKRRGEGDNHFAAALFYQHRESKKMQSSESAVMEAETEKKLHKVIFIKPSGEAVTVDYEPDATPYQEHGLKGSLLDIALNYGIDLQHSCGGNCACTTCHVIVRQGEENLSDMEE